MPAERRRRRTDAWLSRARAWGMVLVSPAWWRLTGEDRRSTRLGVELACWTERQVRRSGLCPSCWMRESEPDILLCDGGSCATFTRLLDTLNPAAETG
ncbi:hypothetical protein ACFWNK_34735 [Streptomyces sp. NPDC058417]|uniref:hypothetical protein n=1 Tax=unclassified Streptomyces TaxID=2593676 RepID=UPI003663664B